MNRRRLRHSILALVCLAVLSGIGLFAWGRPNDCSESVDRLDGLKGSEVWSLLGQGSPDEEEFLPGGFAGSPRAACEAYVASWNSPVTSAFVDIAVERFDSSADAVASLDESREQSYTEERGRMVYERSDTVFERLALQQGCLVVSAVWLWQPDTPAQRDYRLLDSKLDELVDELSWQLCG